MSPAAWSLLCLALTLSNLVLSDIYFRMVRKWSRKNMASNDEMIRWLKRSVGEDDK